ncbi:related to tRNA-specific adenosine deaminase 1 [Claviceps purpurea 20.1]|uniref:Related to tRNA-specific adenosine deaminase 1 n=1 Tax=Claviceps purpurea (strain 20.1) TaxID=1111077 RepID=M1WI07_CLAP2|nr:hypothetical protein E4U25_002795 [Claviceps purpurea]CCE33649.1 related to tRNA-specific adenosine deaminase 1 [Claviceps purpurea 20.1]
MSTTPSATLIARTVISQFNKLPAKRKPTIRDNGLREWVPLSGIVAEKDGDLICLALATGMKCLPASKLCDANGNAIHDWHAEVLAMRAFNRFLLDECMASAQHGQASQVVDVVPPGAGGRPFKIKDNVRLHMYCSEAPCGDASMELIMAAQDDSSPWDITPPPAQSQQDTDQQSPSQSSSEATTAILPGRAYFSQLGIVRRKPGRGDAPPTLSKSCSDKLSLKQCTSLLSSLTSLLIDPSNAYIDSLVLPSSQYSAPACQRAFSERMKALDGSSSWPGGYRFAPFRVETTDEEFAFSRRAVAGKAPNTARDEAGTKIKLAPSNLAAVWTGSGVEETVLGGVLQGRRPFEEKGASSVSRRRMWMAAEEIAISLSSDWEHVQQCLSGRDERRYQSIKECEILAERRLVKQQTRQSALAGWIPNQGDSGFSISCGVWNSLGSE